MKMRYPHTKAESKPLDKKPAGVMFDVVIERILPGGLGLAHAEGLTLFVSLAAPGDTVRVRVDRVQGRVAFASISEVLSPSTVRAEPPCPYFGRCGGCDFQHLTYEAQLAAKVDIIRDCLHRIGKTDCTGDIPITASPNKWEYRSRAQWQYDSLKMRLGYFERGSHRVCDVAACPVLVPELETTLEGLRAKMKNGELPEGLSEFQAVAGDDGVSLAPGLAEHPTREVTRALGEYSYRFSAEGFFQINHDLLEALIAAATNGPNGDTAVDLYCGVGLFTLPLARRFKRVIGVEAQSAAIKYARRNLSDAGFVNAKLKSSRVADWLRENGELSGSVDFLLLDPPRAGAEHRAIEGIIALRPRQIVYVSCDPATLARDIKGLIAGGYAIHSVAAFDMFPQTHHVETVVHLELYRVAKYRS